MLYNFSFIFGDEKARGTKFLSKAEVENKEMEKNLFFLKSSKTGGTTVLSVLQRFGMHYGLDFLIGEGTAGRGATLKY